MITRAMNIDETNTAKNRPKLLTEVENLMRTSSYSHKTIEVYTHWIKEFILFNNKVHPKDLDNNIVEKEIRWLDGGYYIRTIHELLGHSSVRRTMIYTHVIKQGAGITSPLD